MGVIKNTVLGIVGLAVAGGATVAAVPALRNKALDFVASKSDTYQQVVDERDAYKASSEEKDEEIASIQAELEAEKTNVRAIQLRLDTANANLTQANTDKAELQTRLTKANADKAELESQLETATTDKAELQTQYDAKVAEIEIIKTQITEKEQTIATLNSQIADFIAEKTALETRVAELESQVQELKDTSDISVTQEFLNFFGHFEVPNNGTQSFQFFKNFGQYNFQTFKEYLVNGKFVLLQSLFRVYARNDSLNINVSIPSLNTLAITLTDVNYSTNFEFVDADGNLLSETFFDEYSNNTIYGKVSDFSYETYTDAEIMDLANTTSDTPVLKSISARFILVPSFGISNYFNGQIFANGENEITLSWSGRAGDEPNTYFMTNIDGIVKITGADTIEIDGVTYTRMVDVNSQEELLNAIELGQSIRLMSNFEIDQQIEISKDTTIALNGFSLISTPQDSVFTAQLFRVTNGATLSILGGDNERIVRNGDNDGNPFIEDGGNVVLYGGCYSYDVSEYVADGYEVIQDGDIYTVQTKNVQSEFELKSGRYVGPTFETEGNPVTLYL